MALEQCIVIIVAAGHASVACFRVCCQLRNELLFFCDRFWSSLLDGGVIESYRNIVTLVNDVGRVPIESLRPFCIFDCSLIMMGHFIVKFEQICEQGLSVWWNHRPETVSFPSVMLEDFQNEWLFRCRRKAFA